jgi:hypothetical protein
MSRKAWPFLTWVIAMMRKVIRVRTNDVDRVYLLYVIGRLGTFCGTSSVDLRQVIITKKTCVRIIDFGCSGSTTQRTKQLQVITDCIDMQKKQLE